MGQAEIVTGQPSFSLVEPTTAGASFTAIAETTTKPSTNLVYDFQQWTTNTLPSLLRVMPFSNINNGTSVGMRIIGWTRFVQPNGIPFYLPTILGEFVLTYTSGTVPTGDIDPAGTLYLFSGITHVAGTPAPNRYSPATTLASDTALASVMVDVIGSQYVTLDFKSSGSAKMGAFWCTI
jgi:hypothetical protein